MGSLVINEKYKINSDQKHVERVFSSQNNSETYQIRSDHITSGSESDPITSINRQALVLRERRPSVSRFAPFSFSQPKRNLIETARIQIGPIASPPQERHAKPRKGEGGEGRREGRRGREGCWAWGFREILLKA